MLLVLINCAIHADVAESERDLEGTGIPLVSIPEPTPSSQIEIPESFATRSLRPGQEEEEGDVGDIEEILTSAQSTTPRNKAQELNCKDYFLNIIYNNVKTVKGPYP